MFKDKMKSVIGLHAANKDEIKDNIIAKIGSEPVNVTPKPYLKHILTACVAFLMGTFLTVSTVIAVEAAEYNRAVTYLTEQGISIENMTRDEIKSAYFGNLGTSSDSISSEQVCSHNNIIKTQKAVPATCTTAGHSEEIVCEDCGFVLFPMITFPATGIHTYDYSNRCVYCYNHFDICEHLAFELNEDEASYTVTGFKNLPKYISKIHSQELKINIPAKYNDLPITAIGDNAFYINYYNSEYSGYKITELTFPYTVTHIGKYAFCGTDITSVYLPHDLVYIGDYAFESTSSLYSVTFQNKLEYIGKSAFQGSGIISAVLPDSVTYMGEKCFFDCYELKFVKLSPGLREIPASAFARSGIYSANIPEGVEVIGESAFERCENLNEITLPTTLKRVDKYAFAVNLPSTVIVNIPSLEWLETVEFAGRDNIYDEFFPYYGPFKLYKYAVPLN